ncbi:DUF6020 family protein [Bifidobacterium simiiventris]|uniref:DUF6020 family protein n=1 Tax=Bifidobacterium simiiventris TaxID=2834434 RepID=UPI001F3DF7AE|nr:DUF6020 family protein [Bifidobacterium simiiventris]MBW3078161.1 hypothetical protein [Bifidobacterium simiiventris]
MTALSKRVTARRPSTLGTAVRSRFMPYWTLLIVAWLPYLVLVWPGALRDDTLAQYLQTAGLHRYYTQHPLFDTLVFGLFWKVGGMLGSPLIGEAIYTGVQALLLSAGCALVLCYIRKLGAPRWLRVSGLLYLATSYVVVGSVGTMGKDSLHTVFFLPFAVLFAETCLTCGRVLMRRPAALAFVALAFAVIVSKRTALMIVLCAGAPLLAVCARGRIRRRAFVCLLSAIVLAQGVFTPVVAAVTHANQSPSRELWGIMTQSVAQVAHDRPQAISGERKDALDKVMRLDQAALAINPHRTDETFHTLREDPQPSAGEKLAALRAWAGLGLSYPDEYLKAWAGPIHGWWDMRVNFAYPTDSDYLLRGGYLRQWATFLPEDAGIAGRRDVDAADADAVAALRVARIGRDLAPLMGTSRKPAWRRALLGRLRRWVRDDNPLTAMALYVTWIPLMTMAALLVQLMRKRSSSRLGGSSISSQAAVPMPSRPDSSDLPSRPSVFSSLSSRPSEASGETFPPRLRLAAFSLLFFTILSLYASPEALFWYPIPVFLSMPLFSALPFAGACRV